MRSLTTTAALLLTGVLALALVAYVLIGGSRRDKDGAPHCVTSPALNQVKDELFRRAAAARGTNDPAFARISRDSVVRAPARIFRTHRGSASVTCTGTLQVDLPPGVAVADGRRGLASNLKYGLLGTSGGGVRLAMLSKADDIVLPLAAIPQFAQAEAAPEAPPPPAAQTEESAAEASAAPEIARGNPTLARNETPVRRAAPPLRSAADPVRKPPTPTAQRVPVNEPKPPAPATARRSTGTPVLSPQAIASARPSFNCRYARTRSEIAICSDPVLASLDRQMVAQFFSALAVARPGQREMLQRSRNRFLAYRDSCRSAACIADAYRERMRQIRAIMVGSW